MVTYSRDLLERLREKAVKLRQNVISCVGVGTAGHIGGSFSAAEIMTSLYFYKMKYHSAEPEWEGRDYFILSKGHAAILQYSALAEAGFFPVKDLVHCKELGFYLQGHPHLSTPGIEVGTGSLGQGLSLGLGIALGLKMDKKHNRVYVLLGDGELNEGQVWEAVMAASAKNMANLCAIVDNNGLQAQGRLADRLAIEPIASRWYAFGWNVIEIDGHQIEEILVALDAAEKCSSKPTVIVAHTVKGKGLSFAENQTAFHNRALTQEEYDQAVKELESVACKERRGDQRG